MPPGITQQLLMNIVNEAMLSLGVIKEPGNPVISTWISTDTHYAFVEFRNAEEANHGFKLHGMNINGSEIKIGRPKAYDNTMQTIGLNPGSGLDGTKPANANQDAEEIEAAEKKKKAEEEAEDPQAILARQMEDYKAREYF